MAAKKEFVSKLEGTIIPEFKANAVKNGEEFEFKLSDYAGKKLIVFFYPKDNTPG